MISTRRSKQSVLKEISPEYSLEGLMLKLKLQSFGHLMGRADSLEKTDTWKDWKQEEKGMTEDEMVVCHHWLSRHESEQILGESEGQGSLACCSPWGHRVGLSDWTATRLESHNYFLIHWLQNECSVSKHENNIHLIVHLPQKSLVTSCIANEP